jgi:hypothetical protein
MIFIILGLCLTISNTLLDELGSKMKFQEANMKFQKAKWN